MRGAYGLLFHLEVDQALIAEWTSEPSMRAEVERATGLVATGEDLTLYLPRLAELRSQVVGGFLALLRRLSL